jgi:hypothetical protein
VSDLADHTRQIELGKELAAQYIKKRCPDLPCQIYAMRWLAQDPQDLAGDRRRLELFPGDRRETICFPEAELAQAPGTPGGDGALKQRVDRFLAGL